MSKIFAAPRVSSRPLTARDRTREWYLDQKLNRRGRALHKRIKISPCWYLEQYRRRKAVQRLADALRAPLIAGPPLQVESLDSVLKPITFDDSVLRR